MTPQLRIKENAVSGLNEIQIRLMAAELAARHRIPKSTVTHPKGVIVQGDEFMSGKLRDPDYVPYCTPCTPMQRLRRVEDGFICPACGNKANWDLTKFNENIDVQFEAEHAEAGEIAKGRLQAAREVAEAPLDNLRYTLSWQEDIGKKNVGVCDCGKCGQQFFGKRKRKYCRPCQEIINQHLRHGTPNKFSANPENWGNRRDRRHG